jgi:Bacterial alpha-L-rhamnosidase.
LSRIGQALSRFGNGKAAFEIFNKKGENSFAYMWHNANATTMWEILPINETSKKLCLESSSSLNHPMQATFDQWFYEDIAGLKPHADGAGFKIIVFEPTMMDQLEWAEGTLDTPFGITKSSWKNEKGQIQWEIVIPPNASGYVALPSDKKIKINGKKIKLKVINPLKMANIFGSIPGTIKLK